MNLTPETPAPDLLAWLTTRHLTGRAYEAGEECPCCGDPIKVGRIVVTLCRTGTQHMLSAGSGSDLTSAYADAITRYERLY